MRLWESNKCVGCRRKGDKNFPDVEHCIAQSTEAASHVQESKGATVPEKNRRSAISLAKQRSNKRAGVGLRRGAIAQAVKSRRHAAEQDPERGRNWQTTAGNMRGSYERFNLAACCAEKRSTLSQTTPIHSYHRSDVSSRNCAAGPGDGAGGGQVERELHLRC
jgi:hypothetical protein